MRANSGDPIGFWWSHHGRSQTPLDRTARRQKTYVRARSGKKYVYFVSYDGVEIVWRSWVPEWSLWCERERTCDARLIQLLSSIATSRSPTASPKGQPPTHFIPLGMRLWCIVLTYIKLYTITSTTLHLFCWAVDCSCFPQSSSFPFAWWYTIFAWH